MVIVSPSNVTMRFRSSGDMPKARTHDTGMDIDVPIAFFPAFPPVFLNMILRCLSSIIFSPLITYMSPTRFITIRNYITLKHITPCERGDLRFITVRNYITLKPILKRCGISKGFITVRNYITLKRYGASNYNGAEVYHCQKLHHSQTSNYKIHNFFLVYHYQELHHSQTSFPLSFCEIQVYHYQELHHSQTKRGNDLRD